jgi:serine/threonine protein kinase/tetratricopeptide (TPR) repeat protein
MTSAEGDRALKKDSIVSGYRIVEKLGSGGGGEVYLAVDTRLERQVALKFLPPATDKTGENRGRLLDEARAASRVKHPRIVSIFAFDRFEGRDFMVMEYVPGKTAKQLAGGGELPIDPAISIILQVAEGLEAAHSAGIIHGDIKSENIIIDNSGAARISDFGLASFREQYSQKEPESTSGTIPYMSPEQARGDAIDKRSDIFSLGVVAYELISGRLPFQGEFEASIIYSIVNETPEPLARYRDNIPRGLESIILKMMAKNPDDRYQDLSGLIEELKRIRIGGADGKDAPAGKRIWKGIIIAAAVVIAAVASLVYIFKPEKKAPAVQAGRTIAVLPFDNLGNEADQFFSDGISDAIRTDLAKFSSLKVISRTSSMLYRTKSKPLPEIAGELKADYVLEGASTWDKTGEIDRVRISSELIKIPDNIHLWARDYIRTADDILGLQSEIARDVAFQVDSTIHGLEGAGLDLGSSSNLKAYLSYLRGNYYFNHSWDESDVRLAIGFYRDAVEKDSNYALALSALSIGHSTMYREFYDRTYKRLDLARDAAVGSLALIPGLPEGHYALGMYYYSATKYDSAMTELETARQGRPGNSDIYTAIAGVQRSSGDFEGAVANYTKAFELDPLSYLKAFDIGLTYGLSKNYDKAFEYLDNAISLAPDWPLPYIYRAWLVVFAEGDRKKASEIIDSAREKADLDRSEYQEYYWWLSRIIDDDFQTTLDRIRLESDTASYYLYKAQIFRLMGKTKTQKAYSDSAGAVLERKLKDRPEEARFHSQLGLAYAGLGRKEEAIYEGARALNLAPFSKDAFYAQFLVTNLAEIYLIAGDYDSAVDELRLLLSMPGFASAYYLKLDPVWKPLQNNPGFRELIKD